MGFKSISSTPQQKKCLSAHAFGQINDKILNQSNKNTSDLDFSQATKKEPKLLSYNNPALCMWLHSRTFSCFNAIPPPLSPGSDTSEWVVTHRE